MSAASQQIRRGQIYWVDFNPTVGSEQAGVRPAVVVSNDVANQRAATVTVVPCTTQLAPKQYPQNVRLPPNRPLAEAGDVLCGQVRTVSKTRLKTYRADLSEDQLAAVDRALAVALGLSKP